MTPFLIAALRAVFAAMFFSSAVVTLIMASDAPSLSRERSGGIAIGWIFMLAGAFVLVY